MRTTLLTSQNIILSDVLNGQQRLEAAQERVATGLRVQKPSDAPDSIGALLDARSHLTQLQTRKTNIANTLPVMNAAESALNDVSSTLRQIRTLAVQANGAAATQETRNTIADQISQLQSRVKDQLNAQQGNQYLFGGTATAQAPFTASNGTVTYQGNDTPTQISLTAGSSFNVSITGSQLLNSRDGTDLFTNLSSLADSIRNGDSASVAKAQTALDADLNNVVQLRGDLGSRIQYVQLGQSRVEDEITATQGRRSDLQDTDIAEGATEVSSAQLAHEAALAMLGNRNSKSLLDYLR